MTAMPGSSTHPRAGAVAADQTNRRTLRGMLLQPRRQLRYGMHFFAFAVGVALFAQWMSYRAVDVVVGRILQQAGEGETLGPVVADAIGVTMLQTTWLLPIAGIAALIYSSRLFHRFIGPQVSINRHLRRLAAGDTSAECQIRDSDELHELVDEINRLTAALRERGR